MPIAMGSDFVAGGVKLSHDRWLVSSDAAQDKEGSRNCVLLAHGQNSIDETPQIGFYRRVMRRNLKPRIVRVKPLFNVERQEVRYGFVDSGEVRSLRCNHDQTMLGASPHGMYRANPKSSPPC